MDYTKYYRYPDTPVHVASSHAEFLELANLRHRINNELHSLSLEQLITVLDYLKTVRGE